MKLLKPSSLSRVHARIVIESRKSRQCNLTYLLSCAQLDFERGNLRRQFRFPRSAFLQNAVFVFNIGLGGDLLLRLELRQRLHRNDDS